MLEWLRGVSFFIVFAASFIASRPVAATASVFDKSYALVVGIDRYPSPVWPSLAYGKKDARAMASFLESQGYEVRSLFDTQATQVRILRELSDYIAPRLGANDRVVVFFSGHGETRERAGQDFGYIIPYDGGNDVGSWISMAEMRHISTQMGNARHQLFIFDSCYGGQFANKGLLSSIMEDHPHYIDKISENKARQYITAGGKGEQVRAGGPDGYSYFTGYLLRALSGKADLNGDSYVTSSELNAFLQPAASNWDHTPIAGVLPGHEQGDFWFRVADDTTIADFLFDDGPFARWFGTKGADGGASSDDREPTALPIEEQTSGHDAVQYSTYIAEQNNDDGPKCKRKDDLTKIKGIAYLRQQRLFAMGFCTYKDIIDNIARIKNKMPGASSSIDGTKDGYIPWLEQATVLDVQQ